MGNGSPDNLRVLIVAEHASAQWGGEAIIPLHYFRILRQRGIDARLIVHQRTREELEQLLPGDRERIQYIPDTPAHVILHRLGQRLPHTINYFSLQLAVRAISQVLSRRIARRLVAQHGIDVVHQPIPVSPREVSLMYSIGAPVIIGPMNGGMSYPPAFAGMEPRGVMAFVRLGRVLANLANRMVPGKLRAEALVVANERTRDVLPSGAQGRIFTIVENGVDLDLWSPPTARQSDPSRPMRLVFAGRLIEWKGVQFLLEAMARVAGRASIRLDVIGDGAMRPELEARAAQLGIADRVSFIGWLPQAQMAQRFCDADAFVLPSVYECGGAVVLEAMASGLPVIATRWGGPADYLDDSCGILVEPAGRTEFINGLAAAMLKFAENPVLRRSLGDAGRAKVAREFDWQRKVDRMLEVYREIASGRKLRPESIEPAPLAGSTCCPAAEEFEPVAAAMQKSVGV